MVSALTQGQFVSVSFASADRLESQQVVSGIILCEDPAKPGELFLYETLGSILVRGFKTRMEYRLERRGDLFDIEEEFRSTAKTCKDSGIPFPMELATFHEICAMLQ